MDIAVPAINQGPILLMLENHRTNLIWNLCANAPTLSPGIAVRAFSGVGSEPEGANGDATILILVHHFSGGCSRSRGMRKSLR